MKDFPSVVDLINKNNAAKQSKRQESAAELASITVKQQQLMEQAGELKLVSLLGPNDTRIPAYFSEAENAFLPVFEVPSAT